MPKSHFSPIKVEVIMGGEFCLGQPQTVGELRRLLQAFDKELADWGDEAEIGEVWTTRETIRVTLKTGIPG